MSAIGVMLVAGKRIGNVGLRSGLVDHPEIRLVADQALGAEAAEAASREHPAVILIGADGMGGEDVELVGRLHQASSNSKIAVCADDLNGPVLAALWQIPIDGYLSWSDMTPERLHPVLLLVTAGIRVVGAHCMGVLMDVRESGRAGGAEPMLSGLERGTLEGLLAGQREREIADELKVGERR